MKYKVESEEKELIFLYNIEKFKEYSNKVTDFFTYKIYIEMGYTLIEGFIKKAMKNIVKFADEEEIREKLNPSERTKSNNNLKYAILNIFPERYNEFSYRNDIVHCNYFENKSKEEKCVNY